MNDTSDEGCKIRLFFVKYLVSMSQCDVGNGIFILEVGVGELYDFKLTIFIEV